MTSDIVSEIRYELDKLASSRYRKEQGIYAEEKQLRLLRQLLNQIHNNCDIRKIEDFCRVADDCSPSDSILSNLSDLLYDKTH